MTVFASSNFNGTEGDELSVYDANWVKNGTLTGSAEIVSGRARASSTTTACYYYNITPAGADYSVTADVSLPTALTTGANAAGPALRMSTSANTMYFARYNAGAGRVELFKSVAGTATSLGTATRAALTAGVDYPLLLDVSGSSINVTWNGEGSPCISTTDTAITAAGYAGIRYLAAGTPTDTFNFQLDNFSADQAGGGGVSQTVAFTLEDVSASVSQNLSHAQSLTGTLDDVTASISQTVQHSQALSATLDDIAFAASQTVGNATNQTLAITLDGVAVAAVQTLSHSQALDAALDGVTFAASQTLSHSQALAATLDGITVEISQSAAPSSKDQSLAVTLDSIAVSIAQEGPANLIDTHDGFWAKEWKRIRAREKRKYQAEVQERVEEIQDEIAEVEQQIVEVKQAPKPKKSTPARDFYAEQAQIVEHLIARRNQLIDEEDEELLLLL